MAQDSLIEYSGTAASNTSIGGVSAAEGMAPSVVNNLVREICSHLKNYTDDVGGSLDLAGTDTYTVTTNQTLAAYVDGFYIIAKCTNDNTGAATLNGDQIAKNVEGTETALAAGNMQAGSHYGFMYDTAINSSAGGWWLVDINAAGTLPSSTASQFDTACTDDNFLYESDVGKEAVWISVKDMTAATTNGPSAGQTENALGHNYETLDFDGTTAEYASFERMMPKSWDLGTMSYVYSWSSTNTGTEGVALYLQATAVDDGEDSNASWGAAAVEVDNSQGTANDVLISGESGAMTVGGSPSNWDLIQFRIYRDPDHASDTMTEDLKLRGIQIRYNKDTNKDD